MKIFFLLNIRNTENLSLDKINLRRLYSVKAVSVNFTHATMEVSSCYIDSLTECHAIIHILSDRQYVTSRSLQHTHTHTRIGIHPHLLYRKGGTHSYSRLRNQYSSNSSIRAFQNLLASLYSIREMTEKCRYRFYVIAFISSHCQTWIVFSYLPQKNSILFFFARKIYIFF